MTRTPQPPVEEVREDLGLPELERVVHAADAAAILIPPRILRRVIKQNASIATIGLRVPHRKTYLISREELLAVVDPLELDLAPHVTLADVVILLARPTPQQVATFSADEMLLKYWRLLFHARVHMALEQLAAEGKFGPDVVRQRIGEIGESEFDEIRAVLRQEDYLLPPKNDFSIYVEFVAVYLELRAFAEDLLASYFPELPEIGRVDEIVLRDIDAAGLLASTRLAGAPDPQQHADALRKAANRLASRARRQAESRGSPELGRRLLDKARRVGTAGNVVRAAILRTQAGHNAGGDEARSARSAAQGDLDRLARRLHAACGFSMVDMEEWSRALVPLLEYSARGIWTPEARLLYDLQKVCIDHERGIFVLNLWPWIRSFGGEPLKRLLPGQRDVLVVKHLRGARARLAGARLSEQARKRLEGLFETAVHRAEKSLRDRFRPTIHTALDRVQLTAHNLPERVARRKLVDELLDRIVERGFLSMGDLRDALSRNNLKLPDLDFTSLKQWLLGDQLLRADRELAVTLDGVYRRGEIYLRLPQRLSSLAFGTRLGRFLTRYAAIPFGGAYLALEFAYHLKHLFTHFSQGEVPAVSETPEIHHSQFGWWLAVFSLGLFFQGLLHHQGFRTFCLELVWSVGVACRRVLVDLPARVLNLPLVQAVLASTYFRLLERYLLKPAIISMLLGAAISIFFNSRTSLESAVGLFFLVNVLLNSRFGRNVDELVTDWIAQAWHQLRIHVLAAIYRYIVDSFQRMLETIERLLYTVDEWLRFKAGESTATTLLKAVLTPIWRVIDYVIRIFVNVLIEPQINPIKHFPVVTVAHKIILPFTGLLKGILAAPLGTIWAAAIAGPTILLLPGVFGFLVWELKENWRLYAVNRPKNLAPSIVGHHGETIIRFLRPGFRSGTLPKLYAKLRKAHRLAFATGEWKASGRQRAGLHGVEEHLRRFVERELLMLLTESRGWQAGMLTAGEIELGTNRILIELYAPDLGDQSLWIALEEHAGWLVAAVHRRGWLDKLSRRGRYTLANALAGFYKLAGVDLVREQLDAQLPPASQHYAIEERGLVVRGPSAVEVVYPLRDWPPHKSPEGRWPLEMGRPGRRELAFACAPISWQRWLHAWGQDQLGEIPSQPYLAGPQLLPEGNS
jgi:hypothetical protein